MTAGGSISGFNIPISESSNAIAPSYSYRISTNSAFSFSIRNPSPIFIAFNLSGVNRDPRGTHFPSFPSKPVSQVTPPSGLIPSGSGVFAGKTLIPFLLYNVLTCRTTFLNSFLVNTCLYFSAMLTNSVIFTSTLLTRRPFPFPYAIPLSSPSPIIAKTAPTFSKTSPSGGLSFGWTNSWPNELALPLLNDARRTLRQRREHADGVWDVDRVPHRNRRLVARLGIELCRDNRRCPHW